MLVTIERHFAIRRQKNSEEELFRVSVQINYPSREEVLEDITAFLEEDQIRALKKEYDFYSIREVECPEDLQNIPVMSDH